MTGVTRSRKLLLLGVAAVTAATAVVLVVLPARADAAARSVAEQYVDLVAAGGEDDLERLWAMTTTEIPGALRSAGELLLGAEERIEVVSVGEPHEAPVADVPYQVQLEDFVEVEVRYRLAGEEHDWTIVLGKLAGEGGSDVGDWRVVTPLVGSIAWEQPAFADVAKDAYLSGTRQVRRPALLGGSEDLQPLYPAVYSAQARLDPYYASEMSAVAVTAGDPVPPPELRLEPTRLTRERIRRQVWGRFAECSGRVDVLGGCPARDLAQSAGVDVWGGSRWWLGLTDRPSITVDSNGIRVSGGAFRLRSPDGVRVVRFTGTGRYFLDNQSWTPVLFDLDLSEAPR